jgi:hypothetical protein
MARPWKKTGGWPRAGKNGRRSYQVGFYDHEDRSRSKSFASAKGANEWIEEYNTHERHGSDSLRRWLLDLDAVEANAVEAFTIGQVLELYFALNADPSVEGGLAPATFERYRSCANVHILGKASQTRKGKPLPPRPYAKALASQPAVRFNEPDAPRAWREQMMQADVPQPTRTGAWRVLSSALSWAAGSQAVPDIKTNGCMAANERTVNRRRSARRGGSGRAASGRRHGSQVPNWELSPLAVEAIRDQMLRRVKDRDPIFAHRDAAVVSLQYGLGARNQEVWGMRWMSVKETFAEVVEVISYGQLDEWGKTEHSARRRTEIPRLLWEDLLDWRAALRRWGHPACDVDFIIPGDLGGGRYGKRDPRTSAVHFSLSQASKWGGKFFAPAVAKAAEREGLTDIAGATPYALRRGGISLRLRAEDAQTVASECGTSLQMLDRHYAFSIDDLRRFGPRPVDLEWREARAELHREPPSDGPRLRLVA